MPPRSQIAADLMDEVVPLASDYIGNTLVQKVRPLFLFPLSLSFDGCRRADFPTPSCLAAL